ncbi:MAG: lipopolysaccharide heptosyltransferase II [Verrucomicrobiota bacterium]
MNASNRILVRGVNWLGDAIMTTPALHRLRERFPQAHITLLTPEKLADLWPGHPAINRVLTFGANESVWQIAGRLRAEQFDLALALPNSPRSAMELWLAGIPQRVGYGDGGRRWLLTDVVEHRPGVARMEKRSESEIKRLISGAAAKAAPIPASAHHVHHYLHLVSSLGAEAQPVAPHLAVSDDELSAVRAKFNLPADVPLFGLNAGAEYGPAKRWPRERFVAAASEICQRAPCRWIVLGGKADVELASGIATQIQYAVKRQTGGDPIINLAGKTTLRELCAVLKACRVLLTNDTGPMHVAAAVGTPVVVPFGSTSPELTGPGLPGDARHRFLQSAAPCAPCFLRECPIDFRCMNGISVETVVEAVVEAGG